jgi:bacterioferritin-associated ferredoxin
MYVCLCNALTERQVRHAASTGTDSPEAVYRSLGTAPKCGKCIPTVACILREQTSEDKVPALA